MKYANIPLFIPHLGCPHNCIFCNQKTISGTKKFDMKELSETLEKAVSTLHGKETEIAFFGGSFTAIDRTLMISLLELASSYLQKNLVKGIRLSTRPDKIDEEILSILCYYGVTSIELGIQSMDDEVLRCSGRGHSAKDSEHACNLITRHGGFSLGGQMMLGLPKSTLEKEMNTAKAICEMGADSYRVYPTVVLKNTPLEKLYLKQEYEALTLEDAVFRGASVKEIFEKYKLTPLRFGLQEEDGLLLDTVAGAYHPAFGELVENELFYREIEKKLQEIHPKKGSLLEIYVAKNALSKAIGQKKRNKIKLMERFGCRLSFKEHEELKERQIFIKEG